MEIPGEMSLSDFNLFQKLIYDETGINMTDKKRTLLTNRIRKRLLALKIDNYHKYYQYLKNAENRHDEIVQMVNAVTTNVTEFFRNPKQFETYAEKVLPAVMERNAGKKMIRILSAGCSSGEEPYTIAIVFWEKFPVIAETWNIQIDAVDISTDILKQAEAGIYKAEKMKGLTDQQIAKFFDKLDAETFRVKEKVKRLIRFKKFNLKSDSFTAKYDIIFCRNVVIYFDRQIKSNIYQKFFDSMDNSGFFLVGYSEGIINDNRFKYFAPGIYTKNPEGKAPEDLS
jgi:chemotaxis protein methyltransferase CheR